MTFSPRHPHRQPNDRVVVSIHWGGNWGYQISEAQRHFARGLVDAGVDLVHGHSSHHPIGMELYRQRLICYGCGDFLNDYEGIGGYEIFRPHISLMYLLDLSADGTALQLQIVPFRVQKLHLRIAEVTDVAWNRWALPVSRSAKVLLPIPGLRRACAWMPVSDLTRVGTDSPPLWPAGGQAPSITLKRSVEKE
jgi:poly-gamma-glutamate capsule biosynthesis protein CapA/YwtB (metallophosphatase superfamily)